MPTTARSKSGFLKTLFLLALAACAGAAFADDPPSRVARLSVLRGDVSIAPAGEDEWYAANLNRPLVSGDRLSTDSDARTELELGGAAVRLDERSSVSILDLDDSKAQLEITQGTLNLHVDKLYDDQRFEVNTPTLTFVINQPGEYRIDIADGGDATHVTVFDGAGEAYGEGGSRYPVEQGQSYRFNDSRLRDVVVVDVPRPDDFDNWCFARDEHYDGSQARRYVSDEVIGAADLDAYGAWDDRPEYGAIWYPAQVSYGWAPYRDGHWAWIDPWGWTWVDNAPWGFAPFHYGRWVYVGNRWGWLPGPVALRPVYAPALVVFIGGGNWYGGYARGGAPVGWCPLGPRDVYIPPYRVSHGYFTHVNASNTRLLDRDHIGKSYENYAHGRPMRDRDYAYRHDPRAVTAVSHDTFVHARPVAAGRLHLNDKQLAHAGTERSVAPAPIAASRLPAGDSVRTHPRDSQRRSVITHDAPPADATRRRHDPAAARAGEPVREQADASAPAPDTQAPRLRETEPRVIRAPHEERRLTVTRLSPPREVVRNTGQGIVADAPEPHDSSPAAARGRHDRPAYPADSPRAVEPRPLPAGNAVREYRREVPARIERRNNEPAATVNDSYRRTIPPPRRAESTAGVDMPQNRSTASASPRQRQPQENAAPSESRTPVRDQRSSAAPGHEPPTRHGREAHAKNTEQKSEDNSLQPGAPGREPGSPR